MKVSYANKFFFGIFLSCMFFSLAALNGCASLNQAQHTPVKIHDKKEFLVAKAIDSGSDVGSDVHFVFWCGSDAMVVVYNEEIGIELIKVPSGQRVNVSLDRLNYPFNCSPDGKWVVYMDRASTRLDKVDRVMTAEDYGFDPELDVCPLWDCYVADLYRFNVASGKKQRFAVVRAEHPAWEVVSPDGTKAFLGGKHNSSIEMPEPRWEPLWSIYEGLTKDDWDWNWAEARWFKDSSGVVTHGYNKLYVEIFGQGGWAKRFAVKPEFKDSLSALSVDKNGGIYFLASDEAPKEIWSKHFLYRCKIEDNEFYCEIMHTFNEYVNAYVLLPDGDILYRDYDNTCIYRVTPHHRNRECVIGRFYANDLYDGMSLIGISPDGKWLAFERYKRINTPDDILTYENAFFVIELVDE